MKEIVKWTYIHIGQDLVKGTLKGIEVKIKVFKWKEWTGLDEYFMKIRRGYL